MTAAVDTVVGDSRLPAHVTDELRSFVAESSFGWGNRDEPVDDIRR